MFDVVLWFLALIGAVMVIGGMYALLVSVPGIGRYVRIRRM
jgi:hypothetical protein